MVICLLVISICRIIGDRGHNIIFIISKMQSVFPCISITCVKDAVPKFFIVNFGISFSCGRAFSIGMDYLLSGRTYMNVMTYF